MKLIILAIFVFLMSLTFLPFVDAGGTLSCSINGTGTDIIRMSNITNAHAELYTQTNYANRMVCQDTGPASLSIFNTGIPFLKLSSLTNAHVEKVTFSNYNHTASIGTNSSNGTLSIEYRENACEPLETCLATISKNILTPGTNAHIADCVTDPYKIRVCALLDYLEDTTCNNHDQCQNTCVNNVCSNIRAILTGKIINWDTQTPIENADITANLIEKSTILETDTTQTDSLGSYEVGFEYKMNEGERYTINITAVKGEFSTYITKEVIGA